MHFVFNFQNTFGHNHPTPVSHTSPTSTGYNGLVQNQLNMPLNDIINQE